MANLNRDLTVLIHIQNYCKETKETMTVFKNDYEEFKKNNIYRNAISMTIFQIGELVNHLSSEYLEETKDKMNWNMIRGMRNHFAHGYFKMDIRVIFETALEDIPKLKEFIDSEILRINEELKK